MFDFAASRLRSHALLGPVKGLQAARAGAPRSTQPRSRPCGLAGPGPGPGPGPARPTGGAVTGDGSFRLEVPSPSLASVPHSDPRGPDARFCMFPFLEMRRFGLRRRARSGGEEGRAALAELSLSSTVSSPGTRPGPKLPSSASALWAPTVLGTPGAVSARGARPPQTCGPRGGTLPDADSCHPALPPRPVAVSDTRET